MRAAIVAVTRLPWEFVLLAPGNAPDRHAMNVHHGPERYHRLMNEMQRLRGRVYLDDGAIGEEDLTADGRHVLAADVSSWHLLLREGNRVTGCMRFRLHSSRVTFDELGVAGAPPAQCGERGEALRAAVENEIRNAREQGVGFGEAGGWALDAHLRGTTAGIRLVLAVYSLAQMLGDAVVLSTATMRNGSAMILRRIGGDSLRVNESELEPYYDDRYKCEMQLLRFDSRQPSAKYAEGIAAHRSHLLNCEMLSPARIVKTAAAAA